MADICVLYASEDMKITERLVAQLRENWDVWWAEDSIPDGDWEKQVRDEIGNSSAVIPIFSSHSIDNAIFKDEIEWAKKCNRIIFPFLIEDINMPFGFGRINRTTAFNWDGKFNHFGFQQLIRKINTKIKKNTLSIKRHQRINIGSKVLQLPSFIFSLSTHETQISPKDGIELFSFLEPEAILISAYDISKYYSKSKSFLSTIRKIKDTDCLLVLDSGNYEACRKSDHYNCNNVNGWRSKEFRKIVKLINPDLSFSYDNWSRNGDVETIIKRIISNFKADKRSISKSEARLCPIVHLPNKIELKNIGKYASNIIKNVAKELDPLMIAIPERELGDGLIERVKTVRSIRESLNTLGKYYPLHLLGTGNPITIVALAGAGADTFDGLEWCRTVVDYDFGTLFHFQHLDCFIERYLSRLQIENKMIINNEEATYATKVASYNCDFFKDLSKTIRELIHSGNVSHLLKQIPAPNISSEIYKAISQ